MTLEDSAFWKEIAWRLAAAPDASATDAYLAGSFTGLARLLLEEHASTRALELVVALALLARAHVEAARSDRLLPSMLRMVTIEAPRPEHMTAGGLVRTGIEALRRQITEHADAIDAEVRRAQTRFEEELRRTAVELQRAREVVASLEEQIEGLGATPVARLDGGTS